MRSRVATDYAEVSCYLDRKFNYPEFSEKYTREDFAKEYDAAFDLIAEELAKVGSVNTTGLGEGDFSMSRYVDLNRAITVVVDCPEVLSSLVFAAAVTALQRLPEEYVLSFDCHPRLRLHSAGW